MLIKFTKIKEKKRTIKTFEIPSVKKLMKYNMVRISYIASEDYNKDITFKSDWIIWHIEKRVNLIGYDIYIKSNNNFYRYKHVTNHKELCEYITEINKSL